MELKGRKPLDDGSYSKIDRDEYIGRFGIVDDPEGKRRIIAMVDY
jgi:hypothetical protein